MKLFKRPAVAVLALIMVLIMLPAVSASEAMTITIGDAVLTEGNTVVLPVTIANHDVNDPIGSIKSKISYDKENLKLSMITANYSQIDADSNAVGLVMGDTFVTNTATGAVTWASARGLSEAEGTLFWLVFEVQEAAEDGKYTVEIVTHNANTMFSTKNSVEIQDSAVVFEAGTITVKKTKVTAADIMARMVLKNDLRFQFGVPMDALEDWDGVYAVITKKYADDRDDVTKTVAISECAVVVPYYAIEFTGVSAKEMCDTVTLEIFNAEDQLISEQKIDSIKDYAERTLRKSGTKAKAKTQLVDMLNYGAAAQLEFEYSTDALANRDLTEEEQALATQSVTTENNQYIGSRFIMSRLVLKNRIELQFAFRGIDQTCYAEYSFTNHYGEDVTGTISGDQFFPVTGTSYYGVPITAQAIADARNVVRVTVYKANGEKVAHGRDSVESYVNRMSEGGDLLEYIMEFADSSYNALH